MFDFKFPDEAKIKREDMSFGYYDIDGKCRIKKEFAWYVVNSGFVEFGPVELDLDELPNIPLKIHIENDDDERPTEVVFQLFELKITRPEPLSDGIMRVTAVYYWEGA